jgi:hypothetical protein
VSNKRRTLKTLRFHSCIEPTRSIFRARAARLSEVAPPHSKDYKNKAHSHLTDDETSALKNEMTAQWE